MRPESAHQLEGALIAADDILPINLEASSQHPAPAPETAATGACLSVPPPVAANRRNARQSTGPRTPHGKAKSAQNALRHGLRAVSPVVPFEDQGEWEAHQAGVVDALGPQGRLEEDLVDRVALQLWRLRRVARYERDTLACLQAPAPEDRSRPARDPETEEMHKSQLGLDDARAAVKLIAAFPSMAQDAVVSGEDLWRLAVVLKAAAGEHARLEYLADPTSGEPVALADIAADPRRWPVKALRDALPRLAGTITVEALQLRARAAAQEWFVKATVAYDLAREAVEARRRARGEERRRAETERREHIIPGEREREQIARYETTIERSLFRTLGELQMLRAGRAGEPTVVVVQGDDSAGASRR